MEAQTLKAPPAEAKQSLEPILVMGQASEFATLADCMLRFEVEGQAYAYHYHSFALANYSKVLCKMFASTSKDGWEAGVQAIFAGHQRLVALVLAMTHGSPDVKSMISKLGSIQPLSWFEIEDLLRLVEKLDAPVLLKVMH